MDGILRGVQESRRRVAEEQTLIGEGVKAKPTNREQGENAILSLVPCAKLNGQFPLSRPNSSTFGSFQSLPR